MIILILNVTGCVSISALDLFISVPGGITSSPIGIKICGIIAGIKKYKSVIKKNKKKHDKIVLLGKDKLNTVEILILKALMYSHISHD